jgi:tRNA (uracil-5-)-methyltransferase
MREAQRRTDVVLVDPPRCGLDDETRGLVQLYDHILYISCNPSALLADLHVLSDAYTVERMAIFDHFAYSHHLEVGVHLRRRNR